MWRRLIGLAVSGSMVLLAGCSDDQATDPPTPVELADRLVRPDDLDEGWTTMPSSGDVDASGVVTGEAPRNLPSIGLCPWAPDDARDAANGVRWQAYRQLELEPDDPLVPPDDVSGHIVVLHHALSAADEVAMTATFDLLGEGATACFGPVDPGDESAGTTEALPVPELGDDRFGALMTLPEAAGEAEWLVHYVLVRDGPVLGLVVVTDLRAGEGVGPYFTLDDIGEIATAALAGE